MIASERGFNRSFFYCRRNKNIQYPLSIELSPLLNDGRALTYETNDYWDSEKSMFLDIISDMIIYKFYTMRSFKVPNSPYDVPIDFLIKNDIKNVNVNYSVCFTENNLRSRYPMLKNYNSTEIFKVLQSISNTKFKISNYQVRYLLNNKKSSFPYSNYNCNEMLNILNLEVTDEKRSHNGLIVYNRSYSITFPSILASYFFSNVISINVDWIDEKFYKLPEIAQMIYKLIILHDNSKNDICISMRKLAKKLNLIINSSSTHLGIIRKNLDVLKKNCFIKDFNEYSERSNKHVKLIKYVVDNSKLLNEETNQNIENRATVMNVNSNYNER